LLPAAPALVIGALLVLARAARNWPARQVQLVGVAGAVAVLLWNAAWSRRLNVLHAGIEEEKYKQASAWASDHLPSGAVIAAMQQSGALYYYTNFAIIRWDMLQPSDFTRLVTTTNAAKRPLYAILFPFELESLGAFKEHMRGTNWQKIGQVHELTVWHWTPAGQGGR